MFVLYFLCLLQYSFKQKWAECIIKNTEVLHAINLQKQPTKLKLCPKGINWYARCHRKHGSTVSWPLSKCMHVSQGYTHTHAKNITHTYLHTFIMYACIDILISDIVGPAELVHSVYTHRLIKNINIIHALCMYVKHTHLCKKNTHIHVQISHQGSYQHSPWWYCWLSLFTVCTPFTQSKSIKIMHCTLCVCVCVRSIHSVKEASLRDKKNIILLTYLCCLGR